ncbi:MFS transporter [Oceanobacillus neutriphilus]|uniref:Major facilitator superfamily (MFS) profile domain-containing protein n=1 Tax=Oceanobacillus neutriphilus TaxID=531815 RepID=A0ABQ2NQL8_9BACI|nr:MFS transporter [Oceanobacillus neutriphilus]GGP09373.1 hypothetical protein GCM10011346_13180 [Oceanobacillus neutriphilus]
MSNSRQRVKAFILIFTTMFILGGIQNTKGIVLEKVQLDINLDIGQVGTMVSIFQIGFLLASLIAGFVVDKKGIKFMMIAGTVSMIIGLAGTSFAFTVAFFLGFYLVVGVGIGAMTVSVATIIPTFFQSKAGAIFNLANAFFGMGMIFTPLILNAMFSNNISWRFFYAGVAVLVALIILVLLSLENEKVEQGEEINLKSFMSLFADRQVMLVILFILFYVAAEAGFLNFFPIFYTSLDIGGMDAAQKAEVAAYVIASFSILFTLGRFAGGYISFKFGEKRTLVTFSLMALIAIIITRLFITDFAYIAMLFGLSLSVLFPTAQGIGAKITDKIGSLQGLIYVASGLGGALIGWVVGTVSQAFGIQNGFNLLIVFVGLVFIISIFIKTPQKTV